VRDPKFAPQRAMEDGKGDSPHERIENLLSIINYFCHLRERRGSMEGGSLPAWWDWYLFLHGFSTLAHFDAKPIFCDDPSFSPHTKRHASCPTIIFTGTSAFPTTDHTRHTMAPPLPASPDPSLSSYCLTNDLTIAATSTINDWSTDGRGARIRWDKREKNKRGNSITR
jgi:hypothetical protein